MNKPTTKRDELINLIENCIEHINTNLKLLKDPNVNKDHLWLNGIKYGSEEIINSIMEYKLTL